MSRCWEILGIEATSDTRLIKRAYAKLLKVNRPEDDAEAFQRLRDAHDEALARAAWMLEEEEEGEAELVESATQEAPLGSPVTPLGEDVIRNEFAATLEEDPPPADADERIEPHSADSTTTLGQWHQQVRALLEQPEALLSALNEIWTDPRLQLSLGEDWERSLLYLCAQNPACLPLLLAVDAHYGWREGRSELPLHHHQAWATVRRELLRKDVHGLYRLLQQDGEKAFRHGLQQLRVQHIHALDDQEWLECHFAEVLHQQEQLTIEHLELVFAAMGWDAYPSHLPNSSRQQIEYLHGVRQAARQGKELDSLLADWRAHSRSKHAWGKMHQQQVLQSFFEPVPQWRLKLWALNHKAQQFASERLAEIEQFPKHIRDQFNQRNLAFWRRSHDHLGDHPVRTVAIAWLFWFFTLIRVAISAEFPAEWYTWILAAVIPVSGTIGLSSGVLWNRVKDHKWAKRMLGLIVCTGWAFAIIPDALFVGVWAGVSFFTALVTALLSRTSFTDRSAVSTSFWKLLLITSIASMVLLTMALNVKGAP